MIRPSYARASVVLVLTIAALGVATSGCKKKLPKVGAPCETEASFVCDPSGLSRMVCNHQKYALETCTACVQSSSGNGLTGKTSSSSFAGCIGRGTGPVGASCTNESFDCDGNEFVKCADSPSAVWERYKCRGPLGCKRVPKGIACDSSVADLGEHCLNGDIACSTDHKEELRCNGGIWGHASFCGGPKACVSELVNDKTTNVTCDATFAAVGDSCKPDTGSCSMDKQSLLICKDGKLVVGKRCRGGDCGAINSDTIRCERPGLGEAGDPCTGNSSACQTDGKALLDCKDGRFGVRLKCRTCTQTGEHLSCNQ